MRNQLSQYRASLLREPRSLAAKRLEPLLHYHTRLEGMYT
jgi:hypothetical protein